MLCRQPDAPRTEVVTVAGHINEAGDVFAEDYPMAPVQEGDMVALLNAGGYLQAMSSTHCLRPMGSASSSTARAAPSAPQLRRPLDRDPDHRAVLEAMAGVLRVLAPAAPR